MPVKKSYWIMLDKFWSNNALNIFCHRLSFVLEFLIIFGEDFVLFGDFLCFVFAKRELETGAAFTF